MTFFLIIFMPFILMLLLGNSEKITELLKDLTRTIIFFQIFLVLNLFLLKTILGIDTTFVDHKVNPEFLSLKAIVFSNVLAFVLGKTSKFFTDNFTLIFKKGSLNEK